ncbi:MAG: NUDIX hydrolase [Gemmatimonadota bacterium]|nr:NUDIX hydrolase [Gemmatimonadota bacterium]
MAYAVREAEVSVTENRRPAPLTFDMGALSTKKPVVHQTSAGGVVFKRAGGETLVALVCVGQHTRWQLPKGLVEKGESAEAAAVRETREEAGVEGVVEAPLETIEYWYVGAHEGKQVRFHKVVHFFLLKYLSGDVTDHDDEVNDARWIPIGEAREMLAFSSEKKVLAKAATLL